MMKDTKKSREKILFYLFLFLIFFSLIALDLYTKNIVEKKNININLGVLSLIYLQNKGVAFGLFNYNYTYIISTILSLLMFFLIVYLFFLNKIYKNKNISILITIFLAGLLGNLYDRITLHYVRDFIKLPYWPAFNIADACLTTSLIIFFYLVGVKKQKI